MVHSLLNKVVAELQVLLLCHLREIVVSLERYPDFQFKKCLCHFRSSHYCESFAFQITQVGYDKRQKELLYQKFTRCLSTFVLLVHRIFPSTLVELIQVVLVNIKNRCDDIIKLLEVSTKGRQSNFVIKILVKL